MSDERLARANALLSAEPRLRIPSTTRASRMALTPALTALLTVVGAVFGLAVGDPWACATVGCALGIFAGFVLFELRERAS